MTRNLAFYSEINFISSNSACTFQKYKHTNCTLVIYLKREILLVMNTNWHKMLFIKLVNGCQLMQISNKFKVTVSLQHYVVT